MDRIIGFDTQLIIQILFQMFNTLVCIGILSLFIYMPVKLYMQKRSERIKEQFDNAEKALSEALSLKNEYEQKLSEIDKKSSEMIENANKYINSQRERILSEANDEAKTIKNQAMLDIERESQQARSELKNKIVEVAWVMTGSILKKKIDNEMNDEIIDEAINDLGDLKWPN